MMTRCEVQTPTRRMTWPRRMQPVVATELRTWLSVLTSTMKWNGPKSSAETTGE